MLSLTIDLGQLRSSILGHKGANPLPSPPKAVLDRVRRRREALKSIPLQLPQLTGVPVTDEAEVGVNQVHGTIIQMVHVRHNTKLEMKVITLPSSPVYDPSWVIPNARFPPSYEVGVGQWTEWKGLHLKDSSIDSILDDWDNGLKVAPKHGGGRVAPLRYLELANTQVTKMWAFAINCNKNRCYWKGIVYALHMRVTGGEIQSPVEGVEGAAQVPMDLAAAKEHLLATCNIEDDDEGVSKLARALADAVMNWAPKDYEKRLQIKDLVLSMCSHQLRVGEFIKEAFPGNVYPDEVWLVVPLVESLCDYLHATAMFSAAFRMLVHPCRGKHYGASLLLVPTHRRLFIRYHCGAVNCNFCSHYATSFSSLPQSTHKGFLNGSNY
eukprot:gene22293-29370_t